MNQKKLKSLLSKISIIFLVILIILLFYYFYILHFTAYFPYLSSNSRNNKEYFTAKGTAKEDGKLILAATKYYYPSNKDLYDNNGNLLDNNDTGNLIKDNNFVCKWGELKITDIRNFTLGFKIRTFLSLRKLIDSYIRNVEPNFNPESSTCNSQTYMNSFSPILTISNSNTDNLDNYSRTLMISIGPSHQDVPSNSCLKSGYSTEKYALYINSNVYSKPGENNMILLNNIIKNGDNSGNTNKSDTRVDISFYSFYNNDNKLTYTYVKVYVDNKLEYHSKDDNNFHFNFPDNNAIDRSTDNVYLGYCHPDHDNALKNIKNMTDMFKGFSVKRFYFKNNLPDDTTTN